jgi:predicted RNA-binding Zn ribbon-like protein
VAWALRSNLLTSSRAKALLQAAEDSPAKATRVLKRAIDLREALYRIFVALIEKRTPAEADLSVLNAALSTMSRGARIDRTRDGFAWGWNIDEDQLDSVLWPIALSAAELLTSDDLERVGQCADDRGCGWLFLDTSKNRSRRWCDINDCGNRAKQQRYYRRAKARRK